MGVNPDLLHWLQCSHCTLRPTQERRCQPFVFKYQAAILSSSHFWNCFLLHQQRAKLLFKPRPSLLCENQLESKTPKILRKLSICLASPPPDWFKRWTEGNEQLHARESYWRPHFFKKTDKTFSQPLAFDQNWSKVVEYPRRACHQRLVPLSHAFSQALDTEHRLREDAAEREP